MVPFVGAGCFLLSAAQPGFLFLLHLSLEEPAMEGEEAKMLLEVYAGLFELRGPDGWRGPFICMGDLKACRMALSS